MLAAYASMAESVTMGVRLGLLRAHDFRQLFVADTISQVGNQITLLALPLLAILTLDASPAEVGILAACETAAFVLIGLPAGAWVDRMRRRNVLIAGDIGRAVLLASIPIAWWVGGLTMPHLYVVALATGACTVFFDVAYQSYLPFLVGRRGLVEGNSKLEVVHSTSQMGGPTLAGLLVQWLTAPVAIGLDALSFLGSALFVTRIRKREAKVEPVGDTHLGREIAEGLRFVLGNRLLRAIAMCTGTGNLFGTITQTMLLLYLARNLDLSPGTIGVLLSGFGIGALVGAFVVAPIGRVIGHGRTLWIAPLFTGLAGLLLPLAQPGWLLALVAAGTAIQGMGIVVYNVTQVSFRQGLTPDRLLGRMNATMRFLVWGTMPVGALIGGALGGWLGVYTALWIGCAGHLLSVLPVLLSPLRSMRTMPTGEALEPAAT